MSFLTSLTQTASQFELTKREQAQLALREGIERRLDHTKMKECAARGEYEMEVYKEPLPCPGLMHMMPTLQQRFATYNIKLSTRFQQHQWQCVVHTVWRPQPRLLKIAIEPW